MSELLANLSHIFVDILTKFSFEHFNCGRGSLQEFIEAVSSLLCYNPFGLQILYFFLIFRKRERERESTIFSLVYHICKLAFEALFITFGTERNSLIHCGTLLEQRRP